MLEHGAGAWHDLPAMGLALQVISPMPELLSYWMEPADAQQLLRFLNDQIAAWWPSRGGALIGLGAVPLQDIDLAIAELDYVVEDAGLRRRRDRQQHQRRARSARRASIPSSRPARRWARRCSCMRSSPPAWTGWSGPPPLQQVLAYPTDVGLAAASVITGNLLVRRPKLRIAFSHGGGTLAMLLPRLQQGWGVFPALQGAGAGSRRSSRRAACSTTRWCSTRPTLRHLVASFGGTQLMLGTDYPFNFHDRTPVARIEAAGFDDATRRRSWSTATPSAFSACPQGASA